ncbi:nuclear transport factor 2 family protein [Ottowia sp. GY511]|uniref:Nuclear transport factor 2 family protein n=1 Tax=Ottowia flava TaxID=2675430 RepID=A0ABW4KMY3_9BURK|nr:nuclear transport factor 2 family protein [Ottowia sp. GY511]TXK28283.1 nuclear transport factor 2 family protein [Ottowia sp. GY511]
MSTPPQAADIEKLEHAFWQTIVDGRHQEGAAMLTEPAVMVMGRGAMRFDHAQYLQMAGQADAAIEKFALSDVEVLLPTDDVAVITYKVQRTMKPAGGQPAEMATVDSSTWVRQGGQWLCAVHTESMAPAA